MNIFAKVLENWTRYEIFMILSSALLLTIIGVLSSWLFVKDKRAVSFSMISSKTSPLIVVLIIFLANLILSSVSETYSFVFMLTTTLSAINVMTLNNYLVKNRNKKNFDIDFVTREHFSDSIKLISLILLFFTILISFTSGEIRNILIASGISSILSIVINHLVSRILFKDGK
jgi:hypothetical protein